MCKNVYTKLFKLLYLPLPYLPYFSTLVDLFFLYPGILCKMQMVNNFEIFFIIWKPKKALSDVFCGRNISEFNNSWHLDYSDFA